MIIYIVNSELLFEDWDLGQVDDMVTRGHFFQSSSQQHSPHSEKPVHSVQAQTFFPIGLPGSGNPVKQFVPRWLVSSLSSRIARALFSCSVPVGIPSKLTSGLLK